MLWFLLMLLTLLGGGGGQKSDYLQPYKFVKPLADLGDLYKQAEEEEEKASTGPVAEARVGVASPVAEKPLMTSGLSAPPAEPLPQPTALKETRARSRKKSTESDGKVKEDRLLMEEGEPSKKERKEPKDKKAAEAAKAGESNDMKKEDEEAMAEDGDKDNMANHNTELMEGRALPPPRRPNAIKYRVPPKPEDEYYYYYDEYYEDYPDYLPYPGRPAADKKKPAQQPKSAERYPNFPPKQEKKKPTPPPFVTVDKQQKEKSGSKKSSSSNNVKPPKESAAQNGPPPRKSENGERKVSSSTSEQPADIGGTLNRLKSLRKKQQQQTVPLLPNPWDKFNAPPKQQKPDTRRPPSAEEKRYRPKGKPLRPYSDYYNEDYFYEYRPVHINRRQGVPAGGANPLALLVAPLAGIALMTAAAAVAISPVLLTVSLTGKRRRRRDTEEMDEGISPQLEEKLHEIQVLEKFMSSIPDNMEYQHQVLGMYLSCSGYTALANRCLDRVVCEYADTDSKISQEERDVISIVLFNVMSNEFVPEDFKERLKLAARTGRDNHTCLAYECEALADMKANDL